MSRILTVDDDLYMLELCKGILEETGHELRTAEDEGSRPSGSAGNISAFIAGSPGSFSPSTGRPKWFSRSYLSFLSMWAQAFFISTVKCWSSEALIDSIFA